MKIICVGGNSQQGDNAQGVVPTISLKPDSALLRGGKPFFIPDFASEFCFRGAFVFHVCRLGKNIAERFAHRYYDELTIGLDITALDLWEQAKREGLAWDLAKGFDNSAVLGDFMPVHKLDKDTLQFRIAVNQVVEQRGSASEMIWSVDKIIAYVSQFYTLKIGDLIYIAASGSEQLLSIGQHIDGYLGDKQVLHIDIR